MADPRRCSVFGNSRSTVSERVNVSNVRLVATDEFTYAPEKKSETKSFLKSNWPIARLIGKLLKEDRISLCRHREVAIVQWEYRGIWI